MGITCNANAGLVNIEEVTNPYKCRVTGRGQCRDMLVTQVEECYTLMLSDDDGDIVIENGCHDPGLNFTTACECTETWWLHLLE